MRCVLEKLPPLSGLAAHVVTVMKLLLSSIAFFRALFIFPCFLYTACDFHHHKKTAMVRDKKQK